MEAGKGPSEAPQPVVPGQAEVDAYLSEPVAGLEAWPRVTCPTCNGSKRCVALPSRQPAPPLGTLSSCCREVILVVDHAHVDSCNQLLLCRVPGVGRSAGWGGAATTHAAHRGEGGRTEYMAWPVSRSEEV